MVMQGVMKRLLCFMLLLMGSATLMGATIAVTTDRDQVAMNETFQLIFTVRGEQTGEPDFSALNADFQLLGTSSSSQFSVINGDISRSKTYTLQVAPLREGQLEIPAIQFGRDQSTPTVLQVAERAAVPPGTPDAADQLRLTVSLDESESFVQQQVLLTINIYRRIDWQQASLSELDAGGSDLLVKQLGEDRQYRAELDGKTWNVIERKYALFPQQSGELNIRPFSLTTVVADKRQQGGQRSNDPFDRFFSRRPTVQKVVRSAPLSLRVKPALSEVRPWLAARDLSLQENWSVDPQQLQVGESVTRTIAIIGDGVSLGQLPQISPAEVVGIKSYPDKAQTKEQATRDGLLSTSSRKFALIPARAGDIELPVLEVNWWNTAANRVETARLPRRTLKVTGEAVQAAPVSPVAPSVQLSAPPATVPLVDAAPEADTGMNNWLLLSNGILLLLWLLTLYAWWRGRKPGSPAEQLPAQQELVQGKRQLLKHLRSAAAADDANAARDVVLLLARHIWPQSPPASLAQVAERAPAPLALELNNLQQSLYGAQAVNWDGEMIAQQLAAIQVPAATARPASSGLKPMYPVS